MLNEGTKVIEAIKELNLKGITGSELLLKRLQMMGFCDMIIYHELEQMGQPIKKEKQ